MPKNILNLFILFILLPDILFSQEGQLFREASKPEVYVIHDGKKVWIPTSDALLAMGYRWDQVTIVSDGTLDKFPRFNIPSASHTPSSLIFPEDVKPYSLLAEKLNNTQKVISQGKEIQLVEIRGWLKKDLNHLPQGVNDEEGLGYDIPFELIPDYEWLKTNGIDINKVIRVGNIANGGSERILGDSSKKMVNIPIIPCEINSWLWSSYRPQFLPSPPVDWIKFQGLEREILLFPFVPPIKITSIWPFNPPELKAGTYVSVFGSFVTDNPHCASPVWRPNQEGCDRWRPYLGCLVEWKFHSSRWTEIHPVDLIQPNLARKGPKETVFGLLLYADINESNSLDVDLVPNVAKPTLGIWRVAFEQILGPECQDPSGIGFPYHFTKVTKFDDHIHIKAYTSGGNPLSGSPGRIRALYRLWWEEIPAGAVNLNGQATRSNNVQTNKNVTFLIRAIDNNGNLLSGDVFRSNVHVGNTNQSFILTNASTGCFQKVSKGIFWIECPKKSFTFSVNIQNQLYSLTIDMPAYIGQ